MDKFLIGAAVALLGTIVGWALSFLTERSRERREGRTAARVIFFELGVWYTAASDLANFVEISESEISSTAWQNWGAQLARIASHDTMSALALIYTSDSQMLLYQRSAVMERSSLVRVDHLRLVQSDLWRMFQQLGPLAGFTDSELADYLSRIERRRIPDEDADEKNSKP